MRVAKVVFLGVAVLSSAIGSVSEAQVKQASAEAPVPRQSLTFRNQPPEVGQRIWQHATVFANVTTRYTQRGQMISQSNRTLTREQIRRITIISRDSAGHATVRLQYEKARKSLTQRGLVPELKDQPVRGKTYIVSRPEEKLIVTYEDGSTPPKDEVEIVEKNMVSIGRANPLSKFLDGKTVFVGDRLVLPPELAKELGWNGEYGDISDVALRLKSAKSIGERWCGIFSSEINGKSAMAEGAATQMLGDIAIEVESCRTLSANMQVQLNSEQQRGPEGHTFTVAHRGRVNLNTQSRYLK